ncbi:ATP-binding protein [Agathobacter sp.]|uniref:ATP-binding protein n=1 Tax=Agathobacter sp. TaxID=2021311 RepID=UPI003FD89EF9
MKFRYKVLFTNLILLSLGLGLVGYLMIHKNFELAKQTQLKNAIVQNNLVQSSVEYELLQLLNSVSDNSVSQNADNSETSNNNTDNTSARKSSVTASKVTAQLPQIGGRVSSSVRSRDSFFYIYFDGEKVYTDDKSDARISDTLFKNLTTGNKNYVIKEESQKHYIYVTSQSVIDEKNLWIVSKCDASEAYILLDEQIKYFRLIIIVILIAESAAMYFISRYMTKPLEKLNHISEEIAQGDYATRVNVKSHDEIGLLAQKFNIMAQAVSEHVDELNDMVHRREQFVADFTHEIKTPMTSIIGYADTMRSLELPREEQIMALGYIFSEGKRLESMSQKLFELIYLRQHDIEKERVHISDVINAAIKVVGPAYDKNSIMIETDIADAVLLLNRELFITALVNLMDNARKASEEAQQVEVTGKFADNMAGNIPKDKTDIDETESADDGNCTRTYEICIIDHGIGMTKEQAERICDEFYMADKSRARKEGGAGIGMSLVAVILEHHNAKLSVESEPGCGTKMSILLPW